MLSRLLKKLRSPTEDEMRETLKMFQDSGPVMSREHVLAIGGLPPLLPPKDVREDN